MQRPAWPVARSGINAPLALRLQGFYGPLRVMQGMLRGDTWRAKTPVGHECHGPHPRSSAEPPATDPAWRPAIGRAHRDYARKQGVPAPAPYWVREPG